jgi:hypothetical protein
MERTWHTSSSFAAFKNVPVMSPILAEIVEDVEEPTRGITPE